MRARTGVTREEALRAAEACSRLLREQFGARAVYVCGSAAGEAAWHPRSDLDLVGSVCRCPLADLRSRLGTFLKPYLQGLGGGGWAALKTIRSDAP
jgi:predicted nucleotidyltransferase